MNANVNMSLDMIPTVNGKLPVAGSLVSWAGYDWVVVDVNNYTNGVMYLMLDDIHSLTKFGDVNVYAKSELASAAAEFQNTLPNEALSVLDNVTVEGVTSKVFVPTFNMIDSGFQWFCSNQQRVAEYNGTAMAWWTSSPYSGNTTDACFVYADGGIGNGGYVSFSAGFRPCVAVKLRQDTFEITNRKFGTTQAILDEVATADTVRGEPVLFIRDEEGNTLGVLGLYRTYGFQVFKDIRLHGDLGHTEHVRDLPEISKMPMGYELVKGMACIALTEFLHLSGRTLDLGDAYGDVECNIAGKMQTIWTNNTLDKFACEVVNYIAVPHE